MKKLKSIAKYILVSLIEIYDSLIGFPKKTFFFNCKHGLRDNPWHLMLYYLEQGERCHWIANSLAEKQLLDSLKIAQNKNFSFGIRGSKRNALLNFTAKYYFISHSFNDMEIYSKRAPVINLWHGIPFKKMGFDSELDVKRFKLRSFDDSPQRKLNDYVVSSGNDSAKNIASALGVDIKNAYGLGQPRNDRLFAAEKCISNNRRFYLYAPTFRDKEKSIEHIFDVINVFARLSEHLVLRLHPNDKAYKKEFEGFSHVYISENVDPNEDLINADVLISDYSSISFDYAILERPIILYIPDKQKYVELRGGSYYEFDDIFSEVEKAEKPKDLYSLLKGIRNYSPIYPKLKGLHSESKSSSLIYERFH